MTFADVLARYIGRQIEVYATELFLEGTLISVNRDSFVLEVRNGSYVTPDQQVTVFFSNVQGVRVLSEVSI
ncbi:hypothetical protein M3936_04450 [Sutcliffiella horikoshii]|uniref:hypothetical protein n=1 Tax=Sutcliffiella horikoshii TaxID=79883 RepID=UPI002042284D|nr:hypothetical protein [Sutcliffiella horikoshii]MCM3616829.1 hypothetical protein [Sutcliffiella horikoshii]